MRSRHKGISTNVVVAVVIVVVIAAVAAFAYLQYSQGGSSSSTSSSSTVSSTPSTISVSIPSGAGTSQSVNFSPAKITLKIGVNNTVVWTNNDSAAHTVTSTSVPTGANSFDSGNLVQGATFRMTFTVPGTYQYKCSYHFWMQGTVVVVS